MARHPDSGRKISFHITSSTVTTTNGHQRCVDRSKVPELWKPGHLKGKTAGTKMRLARHVKNEDTWQRYVEVETHRHQDTGAPRAMAKVQVKVQAKAKARNEHLQHVCAVERKDTRKQVANSRCNMFELRKGWSLESGVSKHEHTRD